MILQRLYELAERENMLDDLAFEDLPVPFVVKIGPEGQYLGILDTRRPIEDLSRKKSPAKARLDKGKILSAPKAHGNTANVGFARFFVDTLPRALPISEEQKSVNSRTTFWQQINLAADQTQDPALRAAAVFGRNAETDTNLAARIRADVEALQPGPSDRCTMAWQPHVGPTLVESEVVRRWYRNYFAALSEQRQQAGAQGLCQITGQRGPLPAAHSTKINGVPQGLSMGVSLVSNDKAAFESYALDGAVNASIGYRAAEGYTRALNALLANGLSGRPRTSLRVGNVVFLYWTRQRSGEDDLMTLDDPVPEQVERLMESARTGRESHAADPADFYCLCLSANGGRAIVRDYLEVPLPTARINLGRWFDDLRIIDDSFTGQNQLSSCFPLWMLANATVREGDDLPPELPALLIGAALKGTALPMHVLAACLRRIRLETTRQAFRPARMGLIKLILNRLISPGELRMSEMLNPHAPAQSLGYACGQLLALLDRCQRFKSVEAKAGILERFFGSASTVPQAVFPLLLRLNRHHLRQIRDKNRRQAAYLEKDLEERLEPFRASSGGPANFPPMLSLAEQGRFSLGFYHQRADYRRLAAERKAAREAKAK
jgi:CRISPR-associated protein Csd1